MTSFPTPSTSCRRTSVPLSTGCADPRPPPRPATQSVPSVQGARAPFRALWVNLRAYARARRRPPKCAAAHQRGSTSAFNRPRGGSAPRMGNARRRRPRRRPPRRAHHAEVGLIFFFFVLLLLFHHCFSSFMILSHERRTFF